MTTNPSKTMVFRFHSGQSLRAVIDTEAPLYYNLRDTAGNPLVVSKDRVREIVPLSDIDPCPEAFSGATTDPGHSWNAGKCALCGKPRTAADPTPAPLSPEREAEPYRDDVREPLEAAGWRETVEGCVVAPNGALWVETNDRLDSGVDAPDKAWSVSFDSGVPGPVIVAVALAASGVDVPAQLAERNALLAERQETNSKLVELTVALRAAEKRVAELERPAVEAKRNEIRSSYSELIAQCERDRDWHGAFDVQCRLRDREEQWKREDSEGGDR